MTSKQFIVTVGTDAFSPRLNLSDGLLVNPTVEPEPSDFVLLADRTLTRFDGQPEVTGTVVAIMTNAMWKGLIGSSAAPDEMEVDA